MALVLTFSLTSAVSAAEYSALGDLNVRSTPGFGDNRIGFIKKGITVVVDRKLGNWCEITYKLKHAYVSCKWLQLTPQALSIKDDSTVVRSQPRLGFNALAILQKGDMVFLKKNLGSWCYIQRQNKKHGYVKCSALN